VRFRGKANAGPVRRSWTSIPKLMGASRIAHSRAGVSSARSCFDPGPTRPFGICALDCWVGIARRPAGPGRAHEIRWRSSPFEAERERRSASSFPHQKPFFSFEGAPRPSEAAGPAGPCKAAVSDGKRSKLKPFVSQEKGGGGDGPHTGFGTGRFVRLARKPPRVAIAIVHPSARRAGASH